MQAAVTFETPDPSLLCPAVYFSSLHIPFQQRLIPGIFGKWKQNSRVFVLSNHRNSPEAKAGSCADDHLTLCFTAGAHPPSIATSRAAGTVHRARCTLDAGASGSNMIETRVYCGASMFPLDLRKGHGRRVEDPFFCTSDDLGVFLPVLDPLAPHCEQVGGSRVLRMPNLVGDVFA